MVATAEVRVATAVEVVVAATVEVVVAGSVIRVMAVAMLATVMTELAPMIAISATLATTTEVVEVRVTTVEGFEMVFVTCSVVATGSVDWRTN
jgi:hypothetical protein